MAEELQSKQTTEENIKKKKKKKVSENSNVPSKMIIKYQEKSIN